LRVAFAPRGLRSTAGLDHRDGGSVVGQIQKSAVVGLWPIADIREPMKAKKAD
jgi:hypothetical protein